ncbi:MAG: hypothetical protein ACYSR0_10325 [Planctomycetota bacterium]|jgi:uncharacterized membrane protein YfcA
MTLDILITVVATSFIQSIFGVGVLLFGTPLLLLQGYDFINAVIVLLPISLSINLIQIARDYRSVDLDFYKKILIYTIPFVVIFLFVVIRLKINIGMIIGVFLLFVAAKNYSLKVNKVIKFLVRYEKVYFIIMGVIHGLTNLGGSLLTAIVHSKGYEKQITRVTVAVSYATFATFQILTLLVSGYSADIRLSGIGIYLIVGMTIFILTEKIVYMDINNENYSKYFAVFLLLSGVLLCVKSI